jgi:hypothetical protein
VYFELLISTVQSKTDGQDGFSSLSSARIKNRASVPWPPAMDELKLELWGHESKQGTFLRDLEEKGVPFYSLSMEKKIHRRLATAAWFGRLLMMVNGSSDDPPARRTG